MEEKQKISVDQYRNHPPKKKHPYLIKMIFYLVLSIGILIYGGYMIKKYNTPKTEVETDEKTHDEITFEIEYD